MYTHGHAESVLQSHRWRTAANSAGYLLESLPPGTSVLDVGCGPGTITQDLAALVTEGLVVGLDRQPAAFPAGDGLASWVAADAYRLPFCDGSWDVVHAHQVLQHVPEPVAALRELARVARVGGLVAARDADYGAMTWWPEDPQLDAWRDTYSRVARANGGEPDAGRRLLSWALEADLDPTPSASTWCFATPADRAWWGGTWAERTAGSDFGSRAVELGLATHDELIEMAAAWRRWAAAPDGWWIVPSSEMVCRVS